VFYGFLGGKSWKGRISIESNSLGLENARPADGLLVGFQEAVPVEEPRWRDEKILIIKYLITCILINAIINIIS